MTQKTNPVVYFEIPVIDIDRAINFYGFVFKFQFKKKVIDNYEMAIFPFYENQIGISGALAKGEVYKPSKSGIFLYFNVENIDEVLELVRDSGRPILYPKTDNGIAYVAEFEDTEGNRIALCQSKHSI